MAYQRQGHHPRCWFLIELFANDEKNVCLFLKKDILRTLISLNYG